MMAKGYIVTVILPLRCFLFLLPKYIHVYAIMMQYFNILTRGSIATGILSTYITSLASLPVGSKLRNYIHKSEFDIE